MSKGNANYSSIQIISDSESLGDWFEEDPTCDERFMKSQISITLSEDRKRVSIRHSHAGVALNERLFAHVIEKLDDFSHMLFEEGLYHTYIKCAVDPADTTITTYKMSGIELMSA